MQFFLPHSVYLLQLNVLQCQKFNQYMLVDSVKISHTVQPAIFSILYCVSKSKPADCLQSLANTSKNPKLRPATFFLLKSEAQK